MLVVLALLVCWGAPGGGMRGPHHPRGHHHHHHHQPQAQTKLTQDSELIRDIEHIKEDLGDWGMSKEALHKLTPEELDFHYFKLHDFDNNTKLDGLEILQAIHHTIHKEVEEEEGKEGEEGSGGHASEGKPPTEDELPYFIELIDQVLAEDDQDKDGYLSYMEYVIGRQREQTKQDSVKRSLHSHG
ncbi:multiple coagulation factor deficiency protein 2 homolog [Macrosteles quadrilineatus]|uniref:multiple coagulation factor deficiency protein 2 homolog n=1 Tax=Macrosteles quadrilineatus TaxID=74068 RepID=UPI0023E16DAA|nr:multiple coagulation factor deficiency protein 2 homolog [Macrosteles quadrilineatus]XP_054264960.1 multiple coagulation factor deficiency protein 2 homolog [Macrosteles quadrilineatus]XP_054264961.1 multiple coagulation factor deficiency protein 2 homolog [Macrosteles quadrilineatus]XP_054264962.1 multiple coagulation factor deficiency protein 2 homolog [Macrosteles quadrilineatus]